MIIYTILETNDNYSFIYFKIFYLSLANLSFDETIDFKKSGEYPFDSQL
jgi:hypothetical protein